jgi:hypothetical protein
MTIRYVITTCKALGMSARFLTETGEFRIVPRDVPAASREACAYYTDDGRDAIETAKAMRGLAVQP